MLTKKDLKTIIEKTHYIAQQNNNNIRISNAMEAANFAAYIAGYPSWRKLKEDNINKYEPNKNIFDFFLNEKKNNSSIVFENEKIHICKKPNIKKELINKDNKQIVSKIMVGTQYNNITKYNKNYYLNLENTAFIGNKNSAIEKIKTELQIQRQTLIEICEESITTEIYFYFDPIHEIFNSENIEIFFQQSITDHKSFIYIWVSLLTHLLKNYEINLNINFLFQSLTLDFLIELRNELKKQDDFYSDNITNYLNSISYLETKKTSLEHEENTNHILCLLNEINYFYKIGIFKETKRSLLYNFLYKKNTKILMPTNLNNFFYFLNDFIININIENYNNISKGLDIKNNLIFVINKHPHMNKTFLKHNHTILLYGYKEYEYDKINDAHQILFENHSCFKDPNEEFLLFFYKNTQFDGSNCFFNNGEALLNLSEEEAFIWQQNETNFFNLNLIKI